MALTTVNSGYRSKYNCFRSTSQKALRDYAGFAMLEFLSLSLTNLDSFTGSYSPFHMGGHLYPLDIERMYSRIIAVPLSEFVIMITPRPLFAKATA